MGELMNCVGVLFIEGRLPSPAARAAMWLRLFYPCHMNVQHLQKADNVRSVDTKIVRSYTKVAFMLS